MTPLLFKLFAPYIAVVIFWSNFSDAWLAIIAYHVQILFWSRTSFRTIQRPTHWAYFLLALPSVMAGILVYFLLPYIAQENVPTWLAHHHLSGASLLLMIPYFGLIHPWLEQVYWEPLRERTRLAHPLFAGYHILVLASLMSWPWLIVCFCVLLVSSYIWQQSTTRAKSLSVAIVSHTIADFGIVLAAWLLTTRG
jgi:hypothetical protein